MCISLIICTKDRLHKLENCLKNLSRIKTDADWELILVDNGSVDGTLQYIEQFAAQFPGSCHVLTEPKPGLGRARNKGWWAASNEIISFTDDDCYLEKNFFNNVHKCFQEDPAQKFGFLGGRINLYDDADYKIGITEYTTRIEIPPRSFIPAGFIQGSNISFRRAALESVNGFDDELGAGTPYPSEDVDILARMSAEGWHGIYDPRPLVYHHHGRKAPDIPGILANYDMGRGAYYAKCIMNPSISDIYLKSWACLLEKGPPDKNYRELKAAFEFLNTKKKS